MCEWIMKKMIKVEYNKFEDENYKPMIVRNTGIAKVLCLAGSLALAVLLLAILVLIRHNMSLSVYIFCGCSILFIYILAMVIGIFGVVEPAFPRLMDLRLKKNIEKYGLLSDYDDVIADVKKSAFDLLMDEYSYSLAHDKCYSGAGLLITRNFIKGRIYRSYTYQPFLIPTDKVEKIEFRYLPYWRARFYYENIIMLVYLKDGGCLDFFVSNEETGKRSAVDEINRIISLD